VGVLVINSLTLWSVGSSERDALIELTGDIAFAVVSERIRKQKDLAETALRQSEKMETVGQLAGGIAHDFNNLLTAIIGNVDLALENTVEDPAVAQPLQDAGSAARRAADLTAKLLTFSRKAVVVPSVIDMDYVIRETLALLSRSIPATVAIRHVTHEGTWPVVGDTTQMIQVLLNLAINARDAMHGTGTLAIEATNTVVDEGYVAEHSYARPGDFVVVTVSDTGTGMTDDVKKHLFEPFFTTKPVGQGTGLGLSMVFGAVKQAGGWVTAESTVGNGASLSIFLPRSSRTPDAGRPETTEYAAVQGGTETVLVIDDEDVVRTVARRVLERAGYRVFVAGDCSEGLVAFRGHLGDIGVVISDLTMPGMSPRECLQRIHELNPNVAVILSSGYSPDSMFHELLSQFPSGSQAFLAKPYRPEQLLAAVRDVLRPASPGGE
jgi:signal transduction histidine kinase/ActR/RegA family two-component response regulator